ncbi:MAG: hypothetical protein ACYDB4_18970 [Candidatus Dormibacteraceae bacterium]
MTLRITIPHGLSSALLYDGGQTTPAVRELEFMLVRAVPTGKGDVDAGRKYEWLLTAANKRRGRGQ